MMCVPVLKDVGESAKPWYEDCGECEIGGTPRNTLGRVRVLK